jgi:hypothetical protein
MKRVLVGVTAIVLAFCGLGCSRQPSETEVKKGQEEMKKQNDQMTIELPAKID